MDAFFASVEERDHPRFRGLPIVVGSDPKGGTGRGVVSTANYAARKYGIRSALPISKAWQFSEAARRRGLPAAIFLAVNMEKYSGVSAKIMDVLRKQSSHIEQASVDEAYFDLTTAGSYERAEVLARRLKDEIKIKENLTASIGIGPNKLIAKIASDAQKPDGLTVVREEDAEWFLEALPIRTIPGIGPKSEERLAALGVRTVGDARRFSQDALHELMGKWGVELYEKLRGRDESPLIESWEAKSVGEQVTFERDASERIFLEGQLREIATSVYARFQAGGFTTFRTIAIIVRFADFTTKTRSVTLKNNETKLDVIEFQVLRLFMPFLDVRENPDRKAFRLLGVRLEKLA